MADHSKPTLTSTYSNFVNEMDGRFDDLAVGLDPAVTTASNVPTNSIRWNSASTKWQKYNGSAWNDLAATYAISVTGNAGTVTNGIYTTGSYSNPAWITALAGSKITGDIGGNAGTATKLATARNINGVAFDGSAAISVNTNNSITVNDAGAGGTSGSTFNGSAALTISYNSIGAANTTGTNATGTWPISVTGNAATVSDGVYLSTTQTISGAKSFSAETTFASGNTKGIRFTGDPGGGSGDLASIRYYAETGENTILEINVSNDADDNIWLNASGGTTCQNNFTATGDVTAYSDINLKKDLTKIENALDKLSALTGYTYTRIDTGRRQTGLVAQDVQKQLPEAVVEGKYLSVAYGNLAGLIVEAIKELKEEVEDLKSKINP